MADRFKRSLEELGRLATEMGPSIQPQGHDELLGAIAAAAQGLFSAAGCSIALLDEAEHHLVFRIATGSAAEAIVGTRIETHEGIAGWAITSGEVVDITDVATDPRFARDVAESIGYLPRSILAIPLQTERQMLGVMSIIDRAETGGDMGLLGLFADLASLAIETSRVFSHLGRALFETAGRLVEEDRETAQALHEVAAGLDGPSRDLAELAAHINALSLIGPDERRATRQVLEALSAYAAGRRRRG